MKLNRLVSAATRLTRQGRLVDATTLLTDNLLRVLDRTVKTASTATAKAPPATEVSPAKKAPPTAKVAMRAPLPASDRAADRTPDRTPFRAPFRAPFISRALLDRHPVAERSFGDPPEAKGTFLSATHTAVGMTRTYKLFVPSTAEPSPSLVVMLHGCTQDPDDFAAGTRMNAAAEAGGFIVLYPKQSREANSSACWNWFGSKEQRGQGETAFLADLVKSVVADHRIDPARVYVAGLSAGGAMAAILAATHPTLFAAAAVHSGLPAGAASNLPDALLAMRNGAKARPVPTSTRSVPTIVFQGDADKTVHPSNGERVIASVVGDRHCRRTTAKQGDPGRPSFSRTRYLDDEGRDVAELWNLHGAGHAWAGGANAGTYTDPKGIDATGEMLRFFDAQRL